MENEEVKSFRKDSKSPAINSTYRNYNSKEKKHLD